MTETGNYMELVETARDYAINCHLATNHTYDGKPYSVHLQMVFDYGCKYAHLLPAEGAQLALSGCWVHDTIEDCRQTYNDVKKACGEKVAEIAYALTNDKGRTRKERAGENYYKGIRNAPFASFVKICDRLANVSYSKMNNSRMLEAYKREFEDFKRQLWKEEYALMFDELRELLF